MRLAGWTPILLLAGVVAMGYAASSSPDGDACRQSCRAEHARCVDACSDEPEPMECEAACREAAEDCERSCP
jgi:hypothetical protein